MYTHMKRNLVFLQVAKNNSEFHKKKTEFRPSQTLESQTTSEP
jgi:hypothetical protein